MPLYDAKTIQLFRRAAKAQGANAIWAQAIEGVARMVVALCEGRRGQAPIQNLIGAIITTEMVLDQLYLMVTQGQDEAGEQVRRKLHADRMAQLESLVVKIELSPEGRAGPGRPGGGAVH